MSYAAMICSRTSLKGKEPLTEEEVLNLREVLKAVAYELRCILFSLSTHFHSGRWLLPIYEFYCCSLALLHG